MELSVSDLLFRAKLAEHAERYEEMSQYMKQLCEQKKQVLTLEERSLFSVAYKQILSPRRSAWRLMVALEQKEKQNSQKIKKMLEQMQYRQQKEAAAKQEAAEQQAREAAAAAAAAAATPAAVSGTEQSIISTGGKERNKDRDKEKDKEKEKEKEKSASLGSTSSGSSTSGSSSSIQSTSPPSSSPPSSSPATTSTASSSSTATTNTASTSSTTSDISTLHSKLSLSTSHYRSIHDYRLKLESECINICVDCLTLVSQHLMPPIHTDLARTIPQLIATCLNRATGVPNGNMGLLSLTATAGGGGSGGGGSDLGDGGIGGVGGIGVSSTSGSSSSNNSGSLESELSSELSNLSSSTDWLSHLRASSSSSLVFYLKLQGDYRRYLAELSLDNESHRSAQCAHATSYYEIARYLAGTRLSPLDPLRLSVALNSSVFYYELLSRPDRACQLAKTAFDEALAEMQQHSQQHQQLQSQSSSLQTQTTGEWNRQMYKDSQLIMQLLKNNLTVWTSTT